MLFSPLQELLRAPDISVLTAKILTLHMKGSIDFGPFPADFRSDLLLSTCKQKYLWLQQDTYPPTAIAVVVLDALPPLPLLIPLVAA